MRPVKIFSLTRKTESEFKTGSYLAKSLENLDIKPVLEVVFENDGENALGLSEFYNQAILEKSSPEDILLFIHDDVYIHQKNLVEAVNRAIERFNIVGVAGNKSPDFRQPSWCLRFDKDLKSTGWQVLTNLTGSVSHGSFEKPELVNYGESPARCKLLDGLFLAIDAEIGRASCRERV